MNILLAGCGAVGSHVGFEVAAPEHDINLFDNDRVSEDNLGTSLYTRPSIGKTKVSALANLINSKHGNSSQNNRNVIGYRFQKEYDLVIDCLDNAEARNYISRYFAGLDIPVCHIGVAQGVGEISWEQDKFYSPPATRVQICTHVLGQNIIVLTSAVGLIAVNEFYMMGSMTNFLVNANGVVMRS